jgi:hypothetical protein
MLKIGISNKTVEQEFSSAHPLQKHQCEQLPMQKNSFTRAKETSERFQHLRRSTEIRKNALPCHLSLKPGFTLQREKILLHRGKVQ